MKELLWAPVSRLRRSDSSGISVATNRAFTKWFCTQQGVCQTVRGQASDVPKVKGRLVEDWCSSHNRILH